MTLKKGTPGEGWQSSADSFSYTPVHAGTKNSFSAFLAGEVYWAMAHEHTERTPGTKPCLDWLTDGALRCPRCGGKKGAAWIGWVPLYREQDHAPILIIIHENAQDLVRDLQYPDHVIVGRVADKSGVFVRKSDSGLSFKTENANRKHAVDVTRDLVPMWKYPQLEEWIAKTARAKNRAAEEAEHAARLRLSVPPPTSDVEALAIDAEKKSGSSWRSTVDQALNGIRRGVILPSTNGKHEGDS